MSCHERCHSTFVALQWNCHEHSTGVGLQGIFMAPHVISWKLMLPRGASRHFQSLARYLMVGQFHGNIMAALWQSYGNYMARNLVTLPRCFTAPHGISWHLVAPQSVHSTPWRVIVIPRQSHGNAMAILCIILVVVPWRCS